MMKNSQMFVGFHLKTFIFSDETNLKMSQKHVQNVTIAGTLAQNVKTVV
jgi:hypothetical protein